MGAAKQMLFEEMEQTRLDAIRDAADSYSEEEITFIDGINSVRHLTRKQYQRLFDLEERAETAFCMDHVSDKLQER